MTLPQPTAVAAAITGGTPTDVREWITVDIVGSPSASRRGYAVLTEPLDRDGRSLDLANQVRAVILHELRQHPRQPADAILSRAFGIANSIVYDDARINGGKPRQIGATAVIFEGYTATIAHVPPGQVVLVQDHLVYSVPELDSRLPHWAEEGDGAPTAEPLGFAAMIAPLLVQTDLLPGDVVLLCNDATGKVLAESGFELARSGMNMRRFHGLDPDEILDSVRSAAISAGEPNAAITVISFPPNPDTSDIETLQDVAHNAREQFRHARAAMKSVVPVLPEMPKIRKAVPEAEPGEDIQAEPEPPKPNVSFQERIIRLTEGRAGDGRGTWQPRRIESQFGAPGAHGVRRHRRVSSAAGWKGGIPRAPFLSSPVFIGLMLAAVFLLGILAWSQRDIFSPDESVYVPVLAQVDQRLAVADGSDDPVEINTELNLAEENLDRARELGAPGDLISEREAAIQQRRDEANNVFRVQSVRRIGSLPEDLTDGETSAFMTSGGIFLANGNLYRLHPETAQMQMMLEEGREIEGVRVGHLYGVAYDGQFLMVTDGRGLFFASSTDGAIWQAMSMEEINNAGPWPPGAMASFSGSMYLLVPEYRNIYVFETDANIQQVAPTDWVSTGDRINLNIAVDMTIDGNIYVLLEDGQVVTYRSGLEVSRFDLPGFDLESDTPKAIVSGSATGYLYIAVEDADGNGRIIASDREGKNVTVLELPADFDTGGADVQHPFENLQDIVVDEQTGTLYLVNGDAVWSFTYILPALPNQGTPEATP